MIRDFDMRFIISRKNIKILIYLGAILSLSCLLLMDIEKNYSSLRVLPVFYVLALMIFSKKEMFDRFSSSLLVGLYFFKMCILPILLVYGDFYSQIYTSLYLPYWNEAILCAIIEWFTVIIALSLSLKLYKNHTRRIVIFRKHKRPSNKLNCTFPMMIGALGLILIVLLTLNKDLLNYTFFIWEPSTEAIPGPTYYIYMVFFEVFRIVFVLYLIHYLFERNIQLKRTFSALILIMCLCVMSSFRIMTIFIVIVAYLYIAYRDKKFMKWYIFSALFLFFMFVMLTFILSSNMYNNLMVSRVFNIYFGGYIIMAAGLSINMRDGLTIFFNDLWNGNLILTAIWGTRYSSTDVMNANVNQAAIGTFYQMYVQSKAFFGIFAPLPIALLTWFLTFIENKFVFDDDLYHKVLYLFMIVSISIFMIMYSLTMILNFILFRLAFILLMIFIDNRIRITL